MMEEPWLLPYIERAKEFGAKTALDIGANAGEWTDLLLQHFDRVIAVEPDPRAFLSLSVIESPNLMLLNAAANEFCGFSDFYMRPDTLQSSLLEVHPIGAGDQREAPVQSKERIFCFSMDMIFFMAEERFGDLGPLFVKVDVEGAEGSVLAGASVPAYRQAAWLIEVHDKKSDVERGLMRLGYAGATRIAHPYPSAHPEHFWAYTEPTKHET